ncbi:hypothetical protein BS50DRAFT_490427 [Corynespora cassiicola Philippines]|uniref:Integral membrane protein-like protein n=1 Tax=Corynespora cassiicola Philippines TaxID=1448308 RepID=A0A2T2NT33_CORCC|nr:hypothetical protein BS50DRAFT_490427 [Corynespora cassiicola Philippines]
MHKYRFSAIFPFACSVISLALLIVLLVSGNKPGNLAQQYMVAINASRVGQDIIRVEPASSTSTSAAPTATSSSSSSNPLDGLNPLSTSSPLNPNNAGNPLDGVLGGAADSAGDGIGNLVNGFVENMVKDAGLKDYYYLYLNTMCEGNFNDTGANSDGVRVEKCSSYSDVQSGLNVILKDMNPSVVFIGMNVSIPLIAKLTHSLDTLSSNATGFRKAVFGFFVIAIIGSALTALSSLPAIIFPQSRLLIYANIFWAGLASFFAVLAAAILTGLILAIMQTVDGFGEALGVLIHQGNKALLFVWLAWFFAVLAAGYWDTVWFVELRSWSFARRKRSEDEKGNWRGVGREIMRDLKGQKGL